MARDASGNYTLASGTTATFGETPIASSKWNAAFNDLASEMTDSLSRSGDGAMLADLEMGGFRAIDYNLGTAASPSLRPVGSTNTGIYFPSVAEVAVSISGTQRMLVNATGISGDGSQLTALSGAAVGTGINAANITTGTLPVARLNGSTGANFVRGDGTYSNILQGNIAGSYDALTLTNSDTGGSSNVRLQWTHGSGTNAVFSLMSGGLTCVGTNFTFGTTAAEQSVWSTNGANRVVVGSAGNVTVNAPSSGTTLTLGHVAGATGFVINALNNSNAVVIGDGTVSFRQLVSAGAWYSIVTSNHPHIFRTNDTDRVTIAAAGNITIAAPSSGVALGVTAFAGSPGITVSGASTNAILSLSNTTTGNAYTDYLASGVRQFLVGTHRSTDEFRIVSGGNFDSGVQFAITSASTYKFQGAAATAFVPGATSFALRNNADNANNVLVADGGSTTFRASAATTPFAIGNSGTAFTCTLTNSNVQTVTMTGNVAGGSFTLASPVDGQTLNLFITQDATGSRTLGYPTSVKWPGGTAGVLSTAANAVDLLTLTYRSTTGFYYATLLKGFA